MSLSYTALFLSVLDKYIWGHHCFHFNIWNHFEKCNFITDKNLPFCIFNASKSFQKTAWSVLKNFDHALILRQDAPLLPVLLNVYEEQGIR